MGNQAVLIVKFNCSPRTQFTLLSGPVRFVTVWSHCFSSPSSDHCLVSSPPAASSLLNMCSPFLLLHSLHRLLFPQTFLCLSSCSVSTFVQLHVELCCPGQDSCLVELEGPARGSQGAVGFPWCCLCPLTCHLLLRAPLLMSRADFPIRSGACVCAQSGLTLCDPVDHSPPGSSVHRNL